MTDGVTALSPSASLPQEISASMDHLFHIPINGKLSHKIENLYTFPHCIEVKLHKKNKVK
jgi:hypothetical protein